MKKCMYCGKTYPEDAVVCAVDAHPLVPHVPALPPRGPYTLPIEVRSRENWATFLNLKEKPLGLRIATDGLTCHPGGLPMLIKWSEIERLEHHSQTVNAAQTRADVHIYRHGPRGQPIILNLLGLELDPPVVHHILQTCCDKFRPLGLTKPRDMSDWQFPIEIRLSLAHVSGAKIFGAVLLAASALCGLAGGWGGLFLSSPAALIGASSFAFAWYLPRDRNPKIRLTQEGIDYHRGKHSWSIKWDDVARVTVYFSTGGRARMLLFTHATKSELTAKVSGLDRSPKKIFDLVQELRHAQPQNLRHIAEMK